MSKHWPPRNGDTRWLSPEVYDALSPAEKRSLWLERMRQRPRRNFEISGTTIVVMLAAACAGIAVGLDGTKPVRDAWDKTVPEARSAPVTANFGYCKWGGGTNCVVDGDTFYLNGDKVRIAAIDAPETHDYGCESELALGDAATGKLHDLLNSGAVTMTSIDRNRDVYGRLLRNVVVNGADVGQAMVSAGVAREYAGGRRSWC